MYKQSNDLYIIPSNVSEVKQSKAFIVHGVLASLLLVSSYFLIVSLAESLSHAVTEFALLSYLMVPLVITFGFQISLFSFGRQQSKLSKQRSTGATASGGISTASMIACCAHHLADAVALVGLTAFAAFFATYQSGFLLIGLVSNIVGILTSLIHLQRNNFYRSGGFLAKTMRVNFAKARKFAVIIGIVVVVSGFALIAVGNQPDGVVRLQQATLSQNGLTIVAVPKPFALGDSFQIALAFDTHGGSLDFNLAELATLEDNFGNLYNAVGWSGGRGGHNVSGTLAFPPIDANATSTILVLKNIYGATWDFSWTLKN